MPCLIELGTKPLMFTCPYLFFAFSRRLLSSTHIWGHAFKFLEDPITFGNERWDLVNQDIRVSSKTFHGKVGNFCNEKYIVHRCVFFYSLF